MAINLTVEVSRAGDTPLDITDGVVYDVVRVSPGTAEVENTIETSPFMNGGALVNSRRGVTRANLVVRCFGAPSDALQAVEDLRAAVQQWGYTVTVSIDSAVVEAWTCMPATVTPVWDSRIMDAGWVDVEISLPRQP